MSFITKHLLTLHGVVALIPIFLLPALEASAFIGFIFPGETAVLLGGVLASFHRIPLLAAMGAASLGAVLGDSVGYYVGRRWGHQILEKASGRFLKPTSVHKTVAFIAKRGGPGVVIGRFTTALRVLVPGAAGMAEMPYRKFLLFNIIGGVSWSVLFTMLGFAAGDSYAKVEKVAGQASLILLAVVVAAFVTFGLYKHFRTSELET